MKLLTVLSILLISGMSFTAQAQESKTVVYDYALLKREYIGKNEIFTIAYKNESGKTDRIDGYVRASANENNITVYRFNAVNRNYDLVEIPLSAIVSINRSESQKVVAIEKPKLITSRGILKAAGIILISAGLALLIFHNEL